jgi:hypothetical protein
MGEDHSAKALSKSKDINRMLPDVVTNWLTCATLMQGAHPQPGAPAMVLQGYRVQWLQHMICSLSKQRRESSKLLVSTAGRRDSCAIKVAGFRL